MRQDQFESLQARAEQLVDLFLDESKPEHWPGAGLLPSAMDKATRGDRFWCKKDAVATLACAQRIADDLQAEVDAAEKEAEALATKLLSRARTREAHGSP